MIFFFFIFFFISNFLINNESLPSPKDNSVNFESLNNIIFTSPGAITIFKERARGKENLKEISIDYIVTTDQFSRLLTVYENYIDFLEINDLTNEIKQEIENIKSLIRKINFIKKSNASDLSENQMTADKFSNNIKNIEDLSLKLSKNKLALTLYNALIKNEKTMRTFSKIKMRDQITSLYSGELKKVVDVSFANDSELKIMSSPFIYNLFIQKAINESVSGEKKIRDSRINQIKTFKKNQSLCEDLSRDITEYLKVSANRRKYENSKGLEAYFSQFIPTDLFGINVFSKKPGKVAYFLYGLKQQYQSALFYIFNATKTIHWSPGKNTNNKYIEPPGPFAASVFPIKRLSPKQTSGYHWKQQRNKEEIANMERTKDFSKEKIAAKRLELENSLEPYSLGDHINYGIESKEGESYVGDRWNKPINLPYNMVKWIGSTGLSFYGAFSTVKSAINQSYMTVYIFFYINLLIKEMNIAKKIFLKMKKLYEENPELIEIPEFYLMKNILKTEKYKEFMQNIFSWKNSLKGSVKKIINLVSPGYFAYFYFNDLKSNTLFNAIEDFISAIGLSLLKVNLLNRSLEEKKETRENQRLVCIPNITETEDPFIDIELFWSPKNNRSVSNTIQMGKQFESKNLILIGPYRSGKSVMVANLLFSFYLANSGLFAAKSASYSRIDNIYNNFLLTYELEEGESKASTELKSFEKIKNSIKKNPLENNIVFLDELYSGIESAMADSFLLEDLPEILQMKNNIIFLITHSFKLAELVNNPLNSISQYFMLIDFDPMKRLFTHKYKFIKRTNENKFLDFYFNRNEELNKIYKEQVKKIELI